MDVGRYNDDESLMNRLNPLGSSVAHIMLMGIFDCDLQKLIYIKQCVRDIP